MPIGQAQAIGFRPVAFAEYIVCIRTCVSNVDPRSDANDCINLRSSKLVPGRFAVVLFRVVRLSGNPTRQQSVRDYGIRDLAIKIPAPFPMLFPAYIERLVVFRYPLG